MLSAITNASKPTQNQPIDNGLRNFEIPPEIEILMFFKNKK
jgi:hypothetical protein